MLWLAIIAGTLIGTITGLTPGLHINLVASIVAANATALRVLAPLDLGAFLLSMSIAHTFLDNIPAVFLGVAEGGELLSLLPSQRLVLRGEGMKAVLLLTIGSVCSLLLSIALLPVFLWLLPLIFRVCQPYTALLLIGILAWMLWREKDPNTKFWSCVIILASGTLGLIVLRGLNMSDPLLPMLSGLFGASALVQAIINRSTVPSQAAQSETTIKRHDGLTAVGGATIAGAIVTLLPGLGPAQGAMAIRSFLPQLGQEAFLVLTGGINTVNMALSLATMATLGFARNGSMAVMLQLVKRPDTSSLIVYAGVALVTGGIAAVLTLKLGQKVGNFLARTNYSRVSAAVLALVICIVWWRSGIIGLLVLATSTACGLVCIQSGAPRHQLMACIMVPVMWATA